MPWKVKANDRPFHHLPEFEKKTFLCFKKSRYSVSVYTDLFFFFFHGLTFIPPLLALLGTNPEHVKLCWHTPDKEQDVLHIIQQAVQSVNQSSSGYQN